MYRALNHTNIDTLHQASEIVANSSPFLLKSCLKSIQNLDAYIVFRLKKYLYFRVKIIKLSGYHNNLYNLSCGI